MTQTPWLDVGTMATEQYFVYLAKSKDKEKISWPAC